jgi:hypothetical protein
MKAKTGVEAGAGFEGVARTIAAGDPPVWLILGLRQVSPLIGARGKPDEDIEKLMLASARVLEKELPLFVDLAEAGYGFECPDCVKDVLALLPEVIEFLEEDAKSPPRRAGGPDPDTRRLVCAGVVAAASKLLRGKVQPYSKDMYWACEELWCACGNHPTGHSGSGETRSWIEYLKEAKAEDDGWARGIFEQHLTGAK